MKLVSMKLTEKQRKEQFGGCDPCADGAVKDAPDYPWGLRITLNDEQIEALGIKALPGVGGTVAVEAVGIVQSVSDEVVDGGKSNRRIELQFTDLAVAGPSTPIADRLYPKQKKD